ncbi:MAG: bis(5'-nucleosyl)-tetraphosphatase (symmetrical) YqeK [Clostridiales bacterium]|jgi:predicted HD superfamily hydrolase involved in NAD metabolism|nr:bis(5'-nucleosyl)-tetraphosphatase (symmetrical) YqeK [Clostridiales bacterium]
MEIDQIEARLSRMLSPARFRHSVGVRGEAARLAARYGADGVKAELAGLAHDCVKEVPHAAALAMCEIYGIQPDQVARRQTKLIHAWLGAEFAKDNFGLRDAEIYDAIRYHTTAKADMPLLTKIIYIADQIEPGRTFEGVEALRKRAYIDLDAAILDSLDYTIDKLIRNKKMLHPETVNAWNFLLDLP